MTKEKRPGLWDVAIEESNQKQTDDTSATSSGSSALFVGNKNSGKTSIILRFLDRDELPKPTTALEYTFGRRAKGHNIAKDVGHIWELGGGIWLTKLLELPLSVDNVLKTGIILVVDLSAPNEMWLTIESLLTAIRKELDSLSMMDRDVGQKLKQMAADKVKDHVDRDMLSPLPLPLVIVGGKADLFQEMEPEKRKTISKTLRFLAHYYGASLQFFSVKMEALLNKAKVSVSHLLFGTSPSQAVQLEHNKPIFVPAGQDSFEQIGSPPISERDLGRYDAQTPLELWKYAFLQHFPQDRHDDPSKAEDPSRDPQYTETAVDSLRGQRAEELERYRKICERRFQEAKQSLMVNN